jgi:hypothetical protein
MASISYHVPVPKQRAPELTRDEILRIHVLFYDAGHSRTQICLETTHTYKQVCDALKHRLTPQKKRSGRRVSLNTPQRKKLIQWVTASKINRETPWIEIPSILGFDCGEHAIRTAFKKEGFARRVSRKKAPLTQQHADERYKWALEHVNWTDEQWDIVLWSDETWAQPGIHTRIWTTRRIGEAEVYDKDCVQPRYQRKIGWMFWGSMSGKYGRHRGLFWEKGWEKINAGSYSGIIVPVVDEIIQEHPELLFQQDNAKGHAAAFTRSVLEAAEIRVIEWPALSPDLNPIETLWDDMKDYIQNHYPKVHNSYKRLREAVQEAWDSIPHERVIELVRSMRERCQAVIAAKGWHTKY